MIEKIDIKLCLFAIIRLSYKQFAGYSENFDECYRNLEV